jgi:hypothetical protein
MLLTNERSWPGDNAAGCFVEQSSWLPLSAGAIDATGLQRSPGKRSAELWPPLAARYVELPIVPAGFMEHAESTLAVRCLLQQHKMLSCQTRVKSDASFYFDF